MKREAAWTERKARSSVERDTCVATGRAQPINSAVPGVSGSGQGLNWPNLGAAASAVSDLDK